MMLSALRKIKDNGLESNGEEKNDYLDCIFKKSLFKEVRFDLRPEQRRGSHGKGRGSRMCKGPEVELNLVCLRNSQEASVIG